MSPRIPAGRRTQQCGAPEAQAKLRRAEQYMEVRG